MNHIGTELTFLATPAFTELMYALRGSLVFTTYHSGKLGMVSGVERGLRMFLRNFQKPMGIAIRELSDQARWELAIATQDDIQLFESKVGSILDATEEEMVPPDLLFVPKETYTTQALGAHEMAFDSGGQLWFCNTDYSCLATTSDRGTYEPLWQPAWITQLEPQDRCHLNGLALRDGHPGWVTCFAKTNEPNGWRIDPIRRGCLIDCGSGEAIHSGLSMPHSPRAVGDSVWVLNSAYGQVLSIDLRSGRESEVARLPGYTRGLAIVGNVAFIGLSQLRESSAFQGLPIHNSLLPLKCGIVALDIPSGRLIGMLEMTQGCSELFDIQWLPGFVGVQVARSSLIS